MKSTLPVFLLSLALTTSCAGQPTAAAPRLHGETHGALAARPAEWAKPVDPGRNLYQIAPGLYRSVQPQQNDAAWLNKLGIRTIINFRADHRDEDMLNLPNVKLVRVPMDAWRIGDTEIVNALGAIKQAQKDGPVLIHCKLGADRTGAVSAMYRILEQGWTRQQALHELEQGGFGFNPIWVNIPHYIKQADIKKLTSLLADSKNPR